MVNLPRQKPNTLHPDSLNSMQKLPPSPLKQSSKFASLIAELKSLTNEKVDSVAFRGEGEIQTREDVLVWEDQEPQPRTARR